MNGINVQNLSKQYGETRALDNVTVQFDAGKIYGLLGRNGAGKTTLLNAITGRIFADSGTVTMDGAPILENDALLGKIYMQSEQLLYPEGMKVRDALKWAPTFYPAFDANYAQRLTAQFELNPKKKISSLSTGYKTIFKLIMALSTNAPYLILDEPVLGLDANHRDMFYKALIEKFADESCCVILSTHLVEEISGFVEDVVIIHGGRIIRNEPRETLIQSGYTVAGSAERVDAYTAGKTLLGVDAIGGLKSAYVLGKREENPPEGLEFSPMDLQRLFIQLTNTP